jgi:hypothetical protein
VIILDNDWSKLGPLVPIREKPRTARDGEGRGVRGVSAEGLYAASCLNLDTAGAPVCISPSSLNPGHALLFVFLATRSGILLSDPGLPFALDASDD